MKVTIILGTTALLLASSPALAAGSLYVATSPAGAQITVDGKETPLRTPAQLSLPKGPHKVTLTKKGYVPQHRRVAITQGKVQRLSLTLPISLSDRKLRRVASASYRGSGTVTAVTSVSGARIFMNGQDTGLKTPANFKAKSGYYEMRLVHYGASVSRALVVARNQDTVVQVTLKPTRVATPHAKRAATPAARQTAPRQTAPRHAASPTRPARAKVAQADWPAYRAKCLKMYCFRARYIPICDKTLQRCKTRCPGQSSGKVVNPGAYYSCADVCKNQRRFCVQSAMNACIKHCNTRP